MCIELLWSLESSLFESLIFCVFLMRQLEFCRQQIAVQYLLSLQCFRVLFLICTRWQSYFSCLYSSDFFPSYISWKSRELLPATDAFQYAVCPWSVYCLGTSSFCKQDLVTPNTGSKLEVERTKYWFSVFPSSSFAFEWEIVPGFVTGYWHQLWKNKILSVLGEFQNSSNRPSCKISEDWGGQCSVDFVCFLPVDFDFLWGGA